MSYVILIDGAPVESAATEDLARIKAEKVQQNAGQYVDEELTGAFALVGFAPANNPDDISYIKPRDSVPDALVPAVFKQFR